MAKKTHDRQQVIQYGLLIAEHPDFYEIIKKYSPAQVESARLYIESLSQRATLGIEAVASTADLKAKPENGNAGRIKTERAPRITGDPAHRNHNYGGKKRDMSGSGTDNIR